METEALRVVEQLDDFVGHNLGLSRRAADDDTRSPAGVNADSQRELHWSKAGSISPPRSLARADAAARGGSCCGSSASRANSLHDTRAASVRSRSSVSGADGCPADRSGTR